MISRNQLDAAWAVYEELYFPELAPKTRAEYRASYRRVAADLRWPCNHLDIHRWNRGMVTRGYAVTYANVTLFVVKHAARRAEPVTGDAELVRELWRVVPMREPVREPRCPPRDFYTRALEAARNRAERTFLGVLGLAGLRKSEALGLRATDWEPETRTLRVVRQRRRPCRKNRRPHSVVLSPELARDLRWTIDHADETRARHGYFRGAGEGYVWPWSNTYLDHFLRRIRAAFGDAADLYLPPGLGWHAWRHWGASELARAGASVWQVMAWLGDATSDAAVRYVAMVRGETTGDVELLQMRVAQMTGGAGERRPTKKIDKLARPDDGTSGRAVTRSQALAAPRGPSDDEEEVPDERTTHHRPNPRRKRAT